MSIEITGLTKCFGSHAAVDDVSLGVPQGVFCVVVGASGCGKSTLLRLVAGLERADAGTISLERAQVSGPHHHRPPEARGVAVVFQSYALWPHMTVIDNVAFPIRAEGMRGDALRKAAHGHLRTVALQDLAERKPADLSGGQRQRVALARCLASGAKTVLMDEPLANLDPHLRHRMEDELATFHAASGATTLYITHDQREAMALADLLVVMDKGRFLQIAPPDEVYARPASETVARFIGRGAVLSGQRQDGVLRLGPLALKTPGPDGQVKVLIRPEDVSLGAGMSARVAAATYRGGEWEMSLLVEGLQSMLEARSRVRPALGDLVQVKINGHWVLPT
jgi:iron(III) transport system ATP-binding protein